MNALTSLQALQGFAAPAVLTHDTAATVLAGWRLRLSQSSRASAPGASVTAGVDRAKITVHAPQPLDLSAVTQFDSSALACLLAFKRDLAAQNQGLALVAVPEKLQKLAQLCGVDALLLGGADSPSL
jgi:phospholipid transport system transporter-binding protein